MLDDIYTVHENSMAFLPVHDGIGKTKTKIVEFNNFEECHLNPIELVDRNLRFLGSSLRGANEGTRCILGEINMYPVIMNLKHHIVWFPSRSPLNRDCVWLALNHIKNFRENTNKSIIVTFSNDYELDIPVSYHAFKRRIHHAYDLKFKIEQRIKYIFIDPMKKKHSSKYQIVKESNDINYHIRSKDEDDLLNQ